MGSVIDAKGKELKVGDTVLVIKNVFDLDGSIVVSRGKRLVVDKLANGKIVCKWFRISDTNKKPIELPPDRVVLF